MLAGYGDKLDANSDNYKEFLRVVRASVDYALKNPDEVFPAVGKETNTEPGFFKAWFTRFSEFPVLLTGDDTKAIGLLWKRSIELDLLKQAPPVEETIWKPAVQN